MKSSIWLCVSCATFLTGLDVASIPDLQSKLTVTKLKTFVLRAVTDLESSQLNQWAFKVVRYENEEGENSSSIERFDPRHQPNPWQLIRLNNREPTDKEKHDFQLRKHNSDISVPLRLSEIIQSDSLSVIYEDDSYISASFDVHLERLGADASENLNGTLMFAKQEAFIESVKITNSDSFSPVLAANIDSLTLTLEFVKINDAILTHRIDLRMRGSFGLFMEINEVSADIFSDYQFVGL